MHVSPTVLPLSPVLSDSVSRLCVSFVFRPTYSQFNPEGVLANVLGLLLVCFGGVVSYVVTKEEYRRPPNPEEESLSVYFKTLTEGQSPSSP